ncbi:hypothetical protein RB598_005424 [Gaeumannomyces tritici]
MAQMAQQQGRKPQGVYVLILSHALTGHITHFLRIGRFLLDRGWPVGLLGPTSHRARIEAAGIEFFQLRGLADLDEDKLFCRRRGGASEYAKLPPHERAFLDTKTQVLDTIPDQWGSIKETLAALNARGGVGKVVVICDPFVYGYLPLKQGAALPDGVAEPRSLCVSVCPPLIRGAGKVPFGFPFPYDPSPPGAALAEVLWQRWAAMSAPLAAALDGRILEAGAAEGLGGEVMFAGHNYAVHEAILHLGLPSLEYPRDDWPAGFQFVGVFPPEDKVVGGSGSDDDDDGDDETAHVPWWGDFVANASLPRDDPARKRVVLVTQGTVQTDLTELVVPTMRAAAELRGQEGEFVLVAILCRKGAALPEGAEVPTNARVVDYLRYGAVLPYVDVWVQNAGYGAVMQAIAAGIPVVAAGEGQDKAENGRRIAWSGIGVDLTTERPSPEQVKNGVLEVLAEARYRDRVLEMQKEAANFPVADIIDREVQNLARD